MPDKMAEFVVLLQFFQNIGGVARGMKPDVVAVNRIKTLFNGSLFVRRVKAADVSEDNKRAPARPLPPEPLVRSSQLRAALEQKSGQSETSAKKFVAIPETS